MIKYAKVINEETGLCEVGIGTNAEFYKSIGMVELDVQQSDIDNAWYLTEKCPMKSDEEKKKEERERLDNLSMTRGDVFEAMILAKGLGKAQIRSMIEQAELDTVTKALYLNRFDEALDFYRGYPIFDMLGEALGITGTMLDRFFETKDYHYLTTCTLTINTIPENAIVTINEVEQNTITLPYETIVDYKVEYEGYLEQIGQIQLVEDKTIAVELVKEEQASDTSSNSSVGLDKEL